MQMNNELVERAKRLAIESHKGHLRKDGKTPYVKHCEEAYELAVKLGITDEDILAALWLHDAPEDTGLSFDVIRNELNDEVERIVRAITRDVSREDFDERIENADYKVKIVKLIDMAVNCTDLGAEYLKARVRERKVADWKSTYRAIAKEVSPELFDMIEGLLKEWL